MKLLCIAPNAVMHDWWTAEPAQMLKARTLPRPGIMISDKELVELRNCPDHDDLPNSEGHDHRAFQYLREGRTVPVF